MAFSSAKEGGDISARLARALDHGADRLCDAMGRVPRQINRVPVLVHDVDLYHLAPKKQF